MRFAFALLWVGCGPKEAPPDASTDSDSDTGSATASDSETDVPSDTDTSPCDPDDTTPPAVVIGAGRAEWSEVECEGALEIQYGPQGCCHFYGAVKQTGIVLEPYTTIGWEVVTDAGATVTEFGYVEILIGPDGWIPLDDGWAANLDHMVIMTLEEPADVTEQALDVTVRLTAGDGSEHTDTHRIHVFYDG